MRFLLRGKARPSPRRSAPLLDKGFHGDRYLLALIDELAEHTSSFVETGTNVGSTARYVGARWPRLPVHSCEPDGDAFRAAREATRALPNVVLYNLDAQRFLEQLYGSEPRLSEQPVLFWLDAHGYGFEWPLRFEVSFITGRQTSGALLIDDFEVPGQPQFKFAAYDGQVCNWEYIRASLAPGRTYRLLYPQYRDRTSPHHPLTGYVAILFGDIPTPSLQDGRFSGTEFRT